MPVYTDKGLVELFRRWSFWLLVATLAVAVVVLIGWNFDIVQLKSLTPGLLPTNPFSAVCFIISCFAIYLIWTRKERKVFWGRMVSIFCGTIAILVAAQYATGWEFKLDMSLYSETARADAPRMALSSALGFIILNTTLWWMHRGQAKRTVAEYLSVLLLFFALLSIMVHVYQVDLTFPSLHNLPMAPITAFCFVLLSLSVIFINPERGFMVELTSTLTGGKLARAILPVIFLFPVILGYLFLFSPLRYSYGTEFAEAFYTTALIAGFLFVTWRIILALNKTDEERHATSDALREAHEELKAQTQQLDVSNKDLESFTYSVSHDLRAPLRSINGYTEILREDYYDQFDEEGRKVLDVISKNSAKMGRLIDDLLNFSRLGRKSLVLSKTDIQQLAEQVVENLTVEQPHSAKIEIMEGIPAALCDRDLLQVVMRNLISNAVKYCSKSGEPKVTIGWTDQDGETVYFVKDNGVGFDPKYMDKLFGVFQRLHKEADFPGTGVGLAIVHRIIQKHQGEVWADASPNLGATFYFRLPNTETTQEPAEL